METSDLKSKTLSGIFWSFTQKAVTQLISFVVTVILARLLMPSDYGVVAIASMFMILIGMFMNGGMGVALIQKRDADELDFNTVFFTGLVMSVVLYTLLFFTAPVMARIYDSPQLTPIIRVLSLNLLIGALGGVQGAYVYREMEFKKFFLASLPRQIFAAAIGIVMAYKGFGPWALVAQNLTASITDTLVMYSMVDWHPRWMFSFERFKGLFAFGWKKLSADFIGTLCFQLRGYIIGFKYSTTDLGFYNRGEGLPQMIRNNVNGPISGVLFPALSKLQSEPGGVKRGLRRSMRTSTYLVFPLLFGLAAISEQLVPVLYSAKWNPAIPFMQIICITAAMDILNAANLQGLLAIGRSDVVLKIELYKKPVMLLILAVTTFVSAIAIAFGMMLYSFYVLYVNTRPNKVLLNYSLREQLGDILPNVLMASFMAVIVFLLGKVIPNLYVALALQITIGAVLYITMSHFLHNENYEYVKATLLDVYHKKITK